MTPGNNDAILHIDIPGAVCSVKGVTAELGGGLVFSGEMSISTPAINAADITLKRLGMGWSNNKFLLAGVEASGSVHMQQLLGLDVGSASAEINSFPGEERYAFELELNVFDMFEADGELELKRISNGALIPNTLQFKAASEVGVPLVPPVVVAELNGLGGGFSGLADTINGDFFAIPPLKLSVSAKGSVLEVIEGWYTIVIGAGYYKASLTDGTLLEMDVIDEYSWYTELSGEARSYGGTSYSGLKVGGGMKIDLAVPNSDMPFIDAGGEFNASAFAGLDSYTTPSRAYLALAADGKIYGVVQIPASAWFLNRTLKLASAEVALALGGQTTVAVNSASFKDEIRDAFGNISGYGGVAYTGSLIGFPFRIYYIFQDKKVNLTVGKFGGEMDPFDPSPFSVSKLALLDADTGRQVGIMVMNDNLTILGSGKAEGSDISTLSVGTNDASGNGVAITQTDQSEQSYEVVMDSTAPDPDHLAFSLTPDESWSGTIESFANSLTVQKSGEASPLTLTAAAFNANNEITNNDAANIVVGNDCVTLKLPSKGTWTISSGTSAFDISCYYASPYASLDGMNLTGMTLTGSVKDMNGKTNYILRTYFGTERGGTDYILSQSGVPAGGTIGETLPLSGSMAPTGSYYVTTVLQEEITGDFNGDGINESAYVTTDTFVFDTMVNYVNSEQPDAPSNVTLASIGSELMRVRWKPASGGNSVDGYYIRLYQQGNSGWVDTGAGYLLKASNLTKDAEGYYTYDMAVTAGDASLHLEAGNTYKAGIAAFCYLTDKDGDGKSDSFPVESAEAYSTGQYLPDATYPVLTYLPSLSPDGSSMKLLFVKGATQVTITSDVAANIVVTRMDTDTVVTQTPSSSTTLVFDTPADFTGALNLRITATDADGDITVDYIGLRMDETAPLITLDSASFMADRGTGGFSVTGVTESGSTVSVTGVITDSGTSGTVLDAEKVTADENGIFTITGKLNPADTAKGLSAADSATLLLCASDLANNVSEGTFAQVVRATEASYTEGGSTGSSSSITADSTGSISSGLLKTAAQAAGKGGTVTVETSGSSVSVTGEGLQYLINNDCALRLSTSSGNMLIPSKVLAGLKITAESRIEFVLSRPESFNDPKLKVLAAAGYPIYKISILIDGKAIHKLSGEISVMLKGTTFAALDSLSVIHALDNGVYRAIKHTLANGELSFTLDSLSHICVLDGKMAADLLKNPFSDVEKSNWFYNNVLYVYQAGLMLGTDSNAFCPYAGATRAMLVTILQRLDCDAESYKSIFSDVPSGAWYESAVGWAAANGIANGVGNGLFAPDNRITREQLVVMLRNYAKFKGYDVSVGDDTNILSFNDALSISNYAYAAMQWACGDGIINGDTAGNLNPGGYATRAEVAAMLERFIQNTIE